MNDLSNGVISDLDGPGLDVFGLDGPGFDESESDDSTLYNSNGRNDTPLTLVQTLKVMTLATSSDQGPWSVPLYYVYKSRGFYFFSSKDSRHVRDALKQDAVCGASLFADGRTVDSLRGIQMQGVVESVPMTPESLGAAKEYVKKFGIKVNGENVLSFIKGRFRAQLYRFTARQSYYMDNSCGFGSRKRVAL
jgi:uncharacterized protein YhbP (UPF0306 family)